MKISKALVFFVVMTASILNNAPRAEAQSGVELENVSASVKFGDGITFLATVKASIQIQNVSIVIFDEAQGLTHVQPLEIRADGTTEYFFDTRQNILRPFTNVRWSYQFTLADGNTSQSETFFIRLNCSSKHR